MNYLIDLQEKLQDTSSTLAQLERAIALDPQTPSLRVMTESLEKRRQILEDDFLAEAARLGIDVCRYRFFADEPSAELAPLCTTLADFQSLFSIIYHAIKNGPQQRPRLTSLLAAETSFKFGYCFPGSTGIVLTFDNKQMELFSTHTEAMSLIFQMARASTQREVIAYGKQLGSYPVRAMLKWAQDHHQHKLGADITWQRDRQILASLLLQPQEFGVLQEAIAQTQAEYDEQVELIGELVGIELSTRKFHMKLDDGADIRGSLSEMVGRSQVVLPKRYKATMRKTVKVFYTTEEEADATYQLLLLEPQPTS